MATVIEMKGDHQEYKEEVETTDMALFVRTSDEAMLGWDRQRIVDALIRETYVDFDTAKEIAREVEDFIATSKIKMITAPLVRELVDTKLVERGLEQARKMHTRLGMPLYDVDQLILHPNKENANVPHGPEATNLTLAERIKKEYALLSVFSQEIADAHMRGDLHLHDLGFIDRPYCSGQSLEYIKRFGLSLPNSIAMAKPAKHPEVLLAHMVKFAAALQSHFAGAIGWDSINLFFAPYVVGMSDQELEQLAQMMIFEFSQQAVARGGQAIFTDLNLYWEIPKHFENVPAIGPKGEFTGKTYSDYWEESQRFANALFNVYQEGMDPEGLSFFQSRWSILRRNSFKPLAIWIFFTTSARWLRRREIPISSSIAGRPLKSLNVVASVLNWIKRISKMPNNPGRCATVPSKM